MFPPKKQKAKVVATKKRPRTVRLEQDDEIWVDKQSHPDGFSGVVREAIKFYRQAKEQQSDERARTLLDAVGRC